MIAHFVKKFYRNSKVSFMQLVVTKSNTLNALTWIKNGWRLFTLQPTTFMAVSAIVVFISLLGNLNPLFGIVVVFLAPFLSAGFYQLASKVESGEQVTATDVFYYLSQIKTHRVFIRLALLSIVVSIPMTQVALSIQETIQAGAVVDFQTLMTFVFLLGINFMLFAFAIPAAWVAPETPALTLIQQSFKACWINIIPLVLYGVFIFTLAVVSLPIILIGWLIMYSVAVLSFYQMFLTIYQPLQQATPETQEVEPEVEAETSEKTVTENDVDSDTKHDSELTDEQQDVQQEQNDRTDNR